ncbi:MAG: ABC transporter ATP-binding protein [Clostridium sp.]|nr:MAG: ABC transporter ATP-binding protein [Clostridium sp.]
MQQKVGIIAIMYSDNDFYLFDEPLDGLDLTSKELFLEKN